MKGLEKASTRQPEKTAYTHTVFYANGFEFHGCPLDSPKNGVLGILQPGTHQKHLHSWSYYYFEARWFGTNNPAHALEKHRQGFALLHGIDVSDQEWSDFQDRFLHL